MAVVKNPFLSTDARGSLFGLTASMVRGGNIIKKKANPATKYEPEQNRVRSILGWLSRQWGGLTDEQRGSWDAWAIDHPGTDKFGDPFIMSGFNAFMMLNHHAVRFGGGAGMNELPPEDPPAGSVQFFYPVTGVTLPGDIDLSWTALGVPLNEDFWEIQMAGPFQSMGRKSVESRFAHVVTKDGLDDDHTVSGLDEGMYYWFRIRYIANDGQKTAWAVGQATPMLTP
ncbi:hypothetical protein ES703_114981 [subsurface metagenome]